MLPSGKQTEDLATRGRRLYEGSIRDKVPQGNEGKFLALDVDTGEYELDAEAILALRRAQAKRPDAALYLVRIGQKSAYHLGACAPPDAHPMDRSRRDVL